MIDPFGTDFLHRWVVWHFGSGDAALLGWVLVTGLAAWLLARRQPLSASFSRFLVWGIAWMLLGSPPWSNLLQGVLYTAIATWLVLWMRFDWLSRRARLRAVNALATAAPNEPLVLPSWRPVRSAAWWTLWTSIAAIAIWALSASTAAVRPVNRMYLVGDSVSAGQIDGEKTWPQFLAEAYVVDVIDASAPGASVASAKEQLSARMRNCDTVLLEIGGNDMLGPTKDEDLIRGWDELLGLTATPERQALLIELPLMPGRGYVGAAQRALSRKYHQPLLSRREFLGVLTTAGATTDGIHLTEAGHRQMADSIAHQLRLARRPQPEAGHWTRLP